MDLALNRVRFVEGVAAPWIGTGRRTLLPGEVLLVSVQKSRGLSLWTLCNESDEAARPFAQDSRDSWSMARRVLTRTLPCLWMLPAFDQSPGARLFASVARKAAPGEAEPTPSESVLKGDSFGLAFVLAWASSTLQIPVRPDVVALAAIDHSGKLKPVGALEEKIKAVAAATPRISRFIVAKDEHGEQERIALAALAHVEGAHLHVVESCAEAFDVAFSVSLEERLTAEGHTAGTRALIARDLLGLVLNKRTELTEWHPIAKASATALKHWRLSKSESRTSWILHFAFATARRHEGFADRLPSLSERQLTRLVCTKDDTFNMDDRLYVIANYVQHRADTCWPSTRTVAALTKGVLAVRDHEAWPGHARIMGGLARLWANENRLPEALRLQKRALHILLRYPESAREYSFQVAEWYRLSGVLTLPKEFAELEDLVSIEPRLRGAAHNPYVRLARGTALLRLGRTPEAIDPLLSVLSHGESTDYVRASAARRLLSIGRADLAADVPLVAECRGLVDLDRAVEDRDPAAVAAALREIEKYDQARAILKHLRRGTGSHLLKTGAHIAMHYPY